MWKVIIVDDENSVRRGLINSIDWESLNCKVVAEAENGIRGLEVIRNHKPDLVISDIRMPGITGIEMLEKLRKENCDTEFIFLTAYSDFEYARKALKLYAADYLLKPFEDGELEEIIVNLMKKRGSDNEFAYLIRTENERLCSYAVEAIKYIKENYSNDISLSDISRQLEISDSYLSRLFKRDTGYNVMTYLNNYRIYKATVLLDDYHLKVYEVAEKVGYNDINYFSSIFKKVTGISPSKYQKKG